MADKEKLKPCPFCGENKVRKNGDNYQVWCINDDCPDRDFISVDKWQNAYCWKELAKRDAIIKVLVDALEKIEERCKNHGKSPYSDCEGVSDIEWESENALDKIKVEI